MSVNKVILVGNVGKDPVIRYIDTRPVAELSLATTERAYTAANGTRVEERTEWHRLIMWDSAAETAERDCLWRANSAPAPGLTAQV